uniref:Uncharacterized protein n=1 Tax=Physcomitrium patens TaxID=3218 RepID=A0A2K1IXN4_PHYPA|nr:hypothetical protein PHYPA_023858 [Physcomitrium patens]
MSLGNCYLVSLEAIWGTVGLC